MDFIYLEAEVIDIIWRDFVLYFYDYMSFPRD